MAEGQIEEKQIKVEHYYNPKFEVFVRMPAYVYETDDYIEASVKAVYTFEKLAKGHVYLRWYAKVADGMTRLYNDTVLFRKILFLFSFKWIATVLVDKRDKWQKIKAHSNITRIRIIWLQG